MITTSIKAVCLHIGLSCHATLCPVLPCPSVSNHATSYLVSILNLVKTVISSINPIDTVHVQLLSDRCYVICTRKVFDFIKKIYVTLTCMVYIGFR